MPGHYLDAKPHPTDIKIDHHVVLVTHSDWIIAALMELYPDTLGFVPHNGEIVPVLVEDRRESSQKVSKGAKPTKKHSDDYEDEEEDDEDEDEEEPHGKTRAHASKSKSDDDYPTSEKSSGRKSKSKSDDDYPTSKKSSKASKSLKFYVQKPGDGEEKRKSA